MAKSYMRTMSPWQSPILSSIGFKTTSPTGTHPFEDEAPYAISDRSFFTSKDLEESRPMKEQVKNVSLPDESASSEPSAVTYNDAIYFDEELLDAKPNALGSAGVKSLLLRDAGATKMRQDCGSSSLEILRQFEERDTPLGAAAAMPVETSNIPTDALIDVPVGRVASGALKQVENGTDIKSIKQVLADSSDSRHGRGRKIAAEPKRGFAAYGNFSFQPSSLKKSDCCFPESSNDGSAVSMPVESCKLSTDVSISPVDCATGGILKKPDHGSTMKSIKRMLAESLPDSRLGRGRKVASRYRRGRGSGK